MKKLYIITKYDFIFSNVQDYLIQYLDIPINMIADLSLLHNYNFEFNDLILIFNDYDNINYEHLKQLKANIVILTNLKIKCLNISNVQIVTYPLYLQELLNIINNTDINKLSSINEYTIPGYKLKLIYEDIKLESTNLKKSINMTVTEGKILKKLFINFPNQVSKYDIVSFDNTKIEINSLETHMFNIKKKLKQNKFCIEIKKENENYKLILKS